MRPGRMKTMVEISPKEITASKGSGVVKEKKALQLEGRDGRGRFGEIPKGGREKRKGGRRNEGEEGQTYADKHV